MCVHVWGCGVFLYVKEEVRLEDEGEGESGEKRRGESAEGKGGLKWEGE